jgi:hypothetical protein
LYFKKREREERRERVYKVLEKIFDANARSKNTTT